MYCRGDLFYGDTKLRRLYLTVLIKLKIYTINIRFSLEFKTKTVPLAELI
jgi:hypothetical protein